MFTWVGSIEQQSHCSPALHGDWSLATARSITLCVLPLTRSLLMLTTFPAMWGAFRLAARGRRSSSRVGSATAEEMESTETIKNNRRIMIFKMNEPEKGPYHIFINPL